MRHRTRPVPVYISRAHQAPGSHPEVATTRSVFGFKGEKKNCCRRSAVRVCEQGLERRVQIVHPERLVQQEGVLVQHVRMTAVTEYPLAKMTGDPGVFRARRATSAVHTAHGEIHDHDLEPNSVQLG